MVTLRTPALGLFVLIVSSGCSSSSERAPSSSAHASVPEAKREPTGTKVPPGTVDPGGTGPRYPGTGFVVHEWGTNTIVVGSDGAMLRGLHHEEEDLPSFVYDRKSPVVARSHVEVKMETPVAYFYSDAPLRARVDVSFPDGVLTQWYPAVVSYFPWVLEGKGDPVFDKTFPFSSSECRVESTTVRNGRLDWGEVEILPRDAKPNLPDASLEKFTWSHARDVASNPVRVTGVGPAQAALPPQEERFLFYRGLGNFPIDLKVAAANGPDGDDGGIVLTNADASNHAGAVFVLRVEGERAAFKVHGEGLAPKGSLVETAPPATEPIATYVQDLAKAMVAELDKAGLYHDESVAMVKTWARQWFRTPGVRVLYLAPQAWTDAQIPLSISPAPKETVRVMVIRVEAITRVEERVDLAAARDLDGDAVARARGEAHFETLGRFAEPRLRRAMAQMPTASGATTYLDQISGANVSLQTGE